MIGDLQHKMVLVVEGSGNSEDESNILKVAVKELKLSSHNRDTISFTILTHAMIT